MKEEYLHYPANYFTATIKEWKPLLANDNYKDIIIGSLQHLVTTIFPELLEKWPFGERCGVY